MINPCLECPSRNITCTVEQLFMDCSPYQEFEQELLEKLLDGSILEIPQRRRWYHVATRLFD